MLEKVMSPSVNDGDAGCGSGPDGGDAAVTDFGSGVSPTHTAPDIRRAVAGREGVPHVYAI